MRLLLNIGLNIGKLGLLAMLTASLWGCGKDDAPSAESFSAPGGLLQYVADDSPYVFAMLEALPDDVADKLEPQLDLTLKTYQSVIRQAVREAAEEAKDGEDSAEAERMADVLDELAGLLSLEGIREAGLGRESTFVVYGAGLLPVLRARLTDAEAFEAALKRM